MSSRLASEKTDVYEVFIEIHRAAGGVVTHRELRISKGCKPKFSDLKSLLEREFSVSLVVKELNPRLSFEVVSEVEVEVGITALSIVRTNKHPAYILRW